MHLWTTLKESGDTTAPMIWTQPGRWTKFKNNAFENLTIQIVSNT